MARCIPFAVLAIILALVAGSQGAIVFSEDFEGETGMPSGWTEFDDNNSGTFTIGVGHNGAGGNTGSAANYDEPTPGPAEIIGGFFKAPGTITGAQAFTLTFDFKIVPDGTTSDDSAIVIGDLSTPYGAAGSEYLMMIFNEGGANNQLFTVSNGVRTSIVNGFVRSDAGVTGAGLIADRWLRGTLVWTPSSGTSGTVTFTLRELVGNILRASFSTPVIELGSTVQFGFGTFNNQGRFDNLALNASTPVNEVHSVNDVIEVGTGGAIAFDPTTNDTTTFGTLDRSTITILTPPSSGTATVDPRTKQIIYRHTGNTPGADNFQYRVGNFAGAIGAAAVQVAVNGAMRLANSTVRMPLTPPPAGSLQMVDALPGVEFPNAVALAPVPGSPKSLLVASINGAVWLVPDTTVPNPRKVEIFNVATQSLFTRGRSIYGITCHPGFATNGQIFLNYQGDKVGLPPDAQVPNMDNNLGDTNVSCALRVSRFVVTPAQRATLLTSTSTTETNSVKAAVLSSEVRLLNLAEQAIYHSINDLHFGPDGYLYVSFGDEGEQGEPYLNAQSITRDQFSSIIRIDVDRKAGNLEPNPHYSIPTDAGVARFKVPADNPYVGPNPIYNGVAIPAGNLAKVRTEIWATGFRNPFKFHIDQPTGQLWVGDVGMDLWEEVTVVQKGDNAGWSFWEGKHERTDIPHRKPVAVHKEPIYEYAHANGNNSVTGGLLYRGNAYSGFKDKYVFGDFGSSRIWSLTPSLIGGAPVVAELPSGGLSGIVAFEVDQQTEQILLLQHNLTGKVMRLIEAVPSGEDFPQLLSQTGVFADLATLEPNPGVVAYEPNLKFWSDHADKARWFVIKNTADQVGYSRDGNWTFPTGMVWVKHFDMQMNRDFPGSATKRLETRFLVRNSGGTYGVSYRWNDAGTDATLVSVAGVDFDLAVREGGTLQADQVTGGNMVTQKWRIPSRSECLNCHNPAAGHALSMSTRQLNKLGELRNTSGNFLTLLSQAGYLSGFADNPANLPRFHSPADTSASLDERVRSYIAVNCSYCHQPAGGGNDTWDGRGHLTFERMSLFYGKPLSESYHDENDRFVIPGNTTDSLIFNRIQARGAIANGTHNGYSQMPPIATNVVDREGVQLLAAWIENYANTAPAFTGGSTVQSSTSENAPLGTQLGIVAAADLDVRRGIADANALRFTITGGNGRQLFAVDPITGLITVNGALDFEKAPQHLIQITATDNFSPNPRTALHSLTIDLTDITVGDATADANGNGLFDVWEIGFGLTGARDTDLDGSPDFFEFLAGTDPTSAGVGSAAFVRAREYVDQPREGIIYEWRVRNGMALGLDYLPQASNSLQSWSLLQSTGYQVLSIEPDGPGFSKISIRVPKDGAQSFFRLIAPF